MPVIRTYECLDCKEQFEVMHASGNEPDANCPYCVIPMEWRPKGFAIKTNASRAMDETQRILEQDYGVTNINDRQREGDIAAVSEPESQDARDLKERTAAEIRAAAAASATPSDPRLNAAVKSFFGGGSKAAVTPDMVKAALSGANTGPGAYTKENNPLTMLHKGVTSGQMADPLKNARIVGRG
jgi:DNA-directed RNA polymerase subunit RPC12/RpoP